MRIGLVGKISFYYPLILMLLTPYISFSQVDQGEIDGVVIAGSGDNLIEISIFNPSAEDSIKSVRLDTIKSGLWIKNVRIHPDSISLITERDTVRFSVLFDIAPDATENTIDSLMLIASAAGALLDHPRQKVTVKIAESEEPQVIAYPLKQDAPPSYRIDTDEEIFQYCATDIKDINEYDDVAVYFTPRRALSVPEPEKFSFRILNPNGIVITGGGNVVSSTTTGEVYNGKKMLGSEAPGRFVVLLSFGGKNVSEKEEERKYVPGVYTVETIGLESDAGSGLFGQGQGYKEVGEWQTEGSFEVKDGLIHFVGFVTEPLSVGMPRTNSRWKGETSIDALNVEKEQGSVSLIMNTWWQDTKRGGNDVYTAGDNIYKGQSHLNILFPTTILPGKSPKDPQAPPGTSFNEKPVASVEIAWNTTGDQYANYSPEFFCPGPLLGTPNRQFSKKGWEGKIAMNQSLYSPETTLSKTRIPNQGNNVFNIGPVNDYEPFGIPPRQLAWHIRDTETLWLSPIKFSLLQDNSIDFYAFGIYKNIPKPYDGPNPDAPPWGSQIPDHEDEVIANTDIDDNQPENQDIDPEQVDDPETADTDISEVPDGNNTNDPDVPVTEDDIPLPVTPESVNPKNGNVAALIREWITNAEPPENVTEGAQFRYDPWGRKIGRNASGVTATPTGTPDYALATSEETAWSFRTKLNSVNHCTLEEYVLAKLNNESIAHCQGRFKPPEKIAVADFTGLTVSEAKRRISAAGLNPRLTAGPPAQSESEVGIVAAQKQHPGTKIEPGEYIDLLVYGPPSLIVVPDLVGLTIQQAKTNLESLGLVPRLVTIGAAPSNELTHKVKDNDPHAGAEVKGGTIITVKIYGEYVAPSLIVVPNLVGLTIQEAKTNLESLGLIPRLVTIGAAPSNVLTYKVKDSEPHAGAEVKDGTTITVKVYSEYVPTLVTVPDVKNLRFTVAKQQLQNAGLKIQPTLFGPPPREGLSECVRSQKPPALSRVPQGEVIHLEIYSAYVIREVVVPNVLGLTWEEADNILRNAGLQIASTRLGEAPSRNKSQKIETQNPRSGSKATEGSIVQVEIWGKFTEVPDCLVPSWVKNQSPKPNDAFHIAYPPYGGATSYTKDGDKYWVAGRSQPNEYMIIDGVYLKFYDACRKHLKTLKRTGIKPWDFGKTAWEGSVVNQDGTLTGYWYIVWE